MKIAIIALASLAVGLASAQTHTPPKVVDLQVEAEYKSMIELLITQNPNLESFVDVVELNGKRILVATVAVANKRLSDPKNANVYLNMLNVSSLKAKAAISKFLNSHIKTESSSARSQETSKSRDLDGNVSESRKVSSSFETITKEESEFMIRGTRSIASWFSADQTLFYRAIVAELPTK